MITILGQTEEDLVAVEASQNITKNDYEKLVPILVQKIHTYGKIKWYFELNESHHWEAGAMVKDLKFDIEHGKQVEKIAIVGAGFLEEQLTKLLTPLIGGEVRFFERKDGSLALDWLKE